MASVDHRQPLPRMHSASDIAHQGKFVSPLTQVQGFAQAVASSSVVSPRAPPPVPALDFNLFRTNSIYSVDSLSSYGLSRESSAGDEPESPTTPRAAKVALFETRQRAAVNPPSPSADNEAGPSRHTPRPVRHAASHSPPLSQPDLGLFYRTSPSEPVFRPDARNAPLPVQPKTTDTSADWASIHGEQGSDWGEDEAQYQWLDTEGAPEAMNGNGLGNSKQISPGKRLARLKAAVGTKDKGEGRKLRKHIVIPKRAAPPPPTEGEVGPVTTPTARSATLPPAPVILSAPLPPRPWPAEKQPRPARVANTLPRSGSGDLRPPRAPFAGRKVENGPPLAPSNGDVFRPSTRANEDHRSYVFLSPTMIPLKDQAFNLAKPTPRHLIRNSGISMQSVAYSFYDIEGAAPTAPKVEGDSIFPNGTYIKVSASALERDNELRERAISDPTPAPRSLPSSPTTHNAPQERTADDFVARGIEARAKGDLPKSAWYFWKAAIGGSPTGRMYWGLALRHSWGVARDDKRAFVELKQACEDALQQGGIDFIHSPGTSRLKQQQRRGITRDLSLGMFEIANCFLEGVGVKKAPDVAIAYLRFAANMGDLASQEQLGFLLSKGASGIKKDMKEAAKWYRMAMAQGSSNTFGLAWVWKDKYMP